MPSLWKKIIQYFVPPLDKNENSRHEADTTPPVLRAELQIPHTIVERYEAYQHTNTVQERKRGRVDWARLGVEFMTLVFVILSAWMLYRTLEATQLAAIATKNAADAAVSSVDVAKKTLDFTIENARLDQRAWVGVVKVIKPPIISEGTHIMGVQITNSGKTPARKVSTRLHPQWVGKGKTTLPIFLRDESGKPHFSQG